MRKSASGFTIVELLIVIVVIGILAAIVIVAFNGIQNSARNTKTISAVDSWAKAIKLYNAKTGNWPANSCLGSPDTYPDTGIGPYCWSTSYWEVRPAFLSQMEPYIANHPEPDITHIGDATYNRRGALYLANSPTDHQIYAVFSGVSSCPSSSAGSLISGHVQSGGIYCRYQLD